MIAGGLLPLTRSRSRRSAAGAPGAEVAETGRLGSPPRGPLARAAHWYGRRRFGRPLSTVDAYLHHPRLLVGYGSFETAVERSHRVDERLKLLAELKAAAVVGCQWCMDFGSWLSRGQGVPERQLRELPRYRESDAFSVLEWLVLDYASAMTRTPAEVGDDLFARLREHFDEAQLVELTNVIAARTIGPASITRSASTRRSSLQAVSASSRSAPQQPHCENLVKPCGPPFRSGLARRCSRCIGSGGESKDAQDNPFGELLVVRRLSRELDDHALGRADKGQRRGLGGRAGRDRSGSSTRGNETGRALDEDVEGFGDGAPDGVVAAAELNPQCHEHARQVLSAIDGVSARQRDQRRDRVRLSIGESADLLLPGLVYPRHHRQG